MAFDRAVREAEITGKPQRIEPLCEEEFSAEARALVTDIRATLGATTTAIPEVFGVMLRHPRLFKCQMDAGIVFFQGEIPPRERELAVLRVAWWCKAPYEWGEHVDIAKRYGVTDEEVERITAGSDAPGWSDHDRAIIRGVEELLGDQMLSDATWDELAKAWTETQLVEFPALVGAYFATALQQNSLRVRLASDNPGLRHR
ncbi:MAG: carboxymuconolactone decarboxylase family protein [Sphingobium sp.]